MLGTVRKALFIRKGAERCIMVPLGRSWFSRAGGYKHAREDNGTDLLSQPAWVPGRKARSLTNSDVRRHDAADAYLSMHRGSAKHTAEGLAINECDKEFLEQRIVHGAVQMVDEELSVDIFGTLRHDDCAPRIVVKASCNVSFKPALDRLTELERCHAL